MVLAAARLTPYVFPNPSERLGIGLAEEQVDRCGVKGMRKVDNMVAFINDRIRRNKGCNLVFA